METPLTARIRPGEAPLDVVGYERAGGFAGLKKAVSLEPAQIVELVKQSNLRGRGGAGFPTGVKWSVVPSGPNAPRPKYLVANADEMEPGTFKDRLLLEGDPLQLVEGMAIAARAIGAEVGYVFLRQEYRLAEERLNKAIAEAAARGFIGKDVLGSGERFELYVHLSAGRYICGEETALLNALEGKRANPRTKPPFPQVSGLWGKPTVVQNVETLCCVPHVLAKGGDWFKSLSQSPDGGTKLYGAAGRVKKPGLWELPMGTTVREILDRAGGMRDGYALKGLLPGGASTDFLTEQHLDVKMDFTDVQKAGSRMGTGTMIILDDKTCPVGMIRNLLHFFAQESCGWCTPCWSGLAWGEQILAALEEGRGQPGDLEALEDLTRSCAPGRTFCALAPGAVEPLQSGLKYFRKDFERHLELGRCPWR